MLEREHKFYNLTPMVYNTDTINPGLIDSEGLFNRVTNLKNRSDPNETKNSNKVYIQFQYTIMIVIFTRISTIVLIRSISDICFEKFKYIVRENGWKSLLYNVLQHRTQSLDPHCNIVESSVAKRELETSMMTKIFEPMNSTRSHSTRGSVFFFSNDEEKDKDHDEDEN